MPALVQSYRRDDGLPMKKVVANLVALEESVIAALKTALQAVRTGKTVVVAEEVGGPDGHLVRGAEPGLPRRDRALGAVEGAGTADAARARVPAGASGRCLGGRGLCPGGAALDCAGLEARSAEHWVPTTALPELLGVAPGALNNARIHRVLEALDDVGERLQEELARWAYAGGRGSA